MHHGKIPPTARLPRTDVILELKPNVRGHSAKSKALMAARGDKLHDAEDNTKLYALAACNEYVRTVFFIAAAPHWNIQSCVVKGAFLNGLLLKYPRIWIRFFKTTGIL